MPGLDSGSWLQLCPRAGPGKQQWQLPHQVPAAQVHNYFVSAFRPALALALALGKWASGQELFAHVPLNLVSFKNYTSF